MADTAGPQVIVDQPLPLISNSVLGDVTTASTPTYSSPDSSSGLVPTIIKDTPHPEPIIAQETISQSIDTQSRKILGNYTFAQVGAIQVGTYVNGVSGEILISPSGIKATNVNGATTFTLDGTTGSATFLGTLSAGTLLGGDANVVIEGSGSGGRMTIYISAVASILIGYQSGGF